MPAVEAIINASAILFESMQSCTAASTLPVSRASIVTSLTYALILKSYTHSHPEHILNRYKLWACIVEVWEREQTDPFPEKNRQFYLKFALVVVFRQTENKWRHYRPSSSKLLKPDSLDTIERRNTMWLSWRLLRVFHLQLLAYSDSNNKFDYPSRRKPLSRYRLDTTTSPERRADEFA
uniref:Uncharacterized protein n=1 Tax=Glossina pallidipes TaxID=7398 RepID=A0A1A9Z4H9_GLOPL